MSTEDFPQEAFFMRLKIQTIILVFLFIVNIDCKSSDPQTEQANDPPSVEDKEAQDSNSQERNYSDMGSSDPEEESKVPLQKSDAKGCIKGDCVGGFGVYVYENKDTYTGNFKDDMRDGEGSFSYSEGESFKGNYAKDLREGKGLYEFSNGDKFAGEFKAGEITGPGVYTFKNGKILTGSFSGNGSTGSGTLVDGGKTRNCKVEARKLSCED